VRGPGGASRTLIPAPCLIPQIRYPLQSGKKNGFTSYGICMGEYAMSDSGSERKPETAMVTGGGGFLGSAIVRRLAEKGVRVRSFARNRYPELTKLNVTQIQGDIADREAVTDACAGAEIVFHTAAKPGVWGKYEDYFRPNVTGTENVIAACRKHRVPRLIHTSSPSVVFPGGDMEGADESVPYPETFHAHYPETKALAEQRVRKAASGELRVIILRPHLIWGPGDNHLVPRILARARQLAIIGDGKNLVDTIYIDNAAEAHLLAAEQLKAHPELSGNLYFISQDEPMPLWDMVNAILRAGGHGPVRRTISRKTAMRIGSLMEWVYKTFRIPGEPRMTRFVAEELATAHWFDISAAKRDLGYVPRISTGEGLRRLEGWLQANSPECEK
jgi:nucleoside-diphosphate-sugar epimerase